MLRVIARMNVGGPALQVTGLVRGMDRQRFDHRVLTGEVQEGEADFLALRAPDLGVERVPGLGRSVRALNDARAMAAIREHVRTFRPHIVHTHTAKAGLLGRVAAWSSGVPLTVHTFHGHLLHGYFSPPVAAGVRLLERGMARRTSALIAVGEHVRDDLLAAGIGRPERFHVFPPGIELPPCPSRSAARRSLGLAREGVVVCYVARLTHVKRPDRFVALADEVARRRDDVTFLVVGEGPLYEQMRQDAAHLDRRVRFLGWRADVETIYAASDIAVLTSDNEGMPVSLIEASLAGLPCVTTDVGSAGEVVLDGRTGRVVSPQVDELAAALLALAEDPEERTRLGEAARSHARASYGSAQLVRDTERLYEMLVAGITVGP